MRWILVAAAVALVAAAGFSISGSSSAHAVFGAVGTGQQVTPITHRQFPAPPAASGCYRYVNAGWRRVDCATPAYIQQHFPHPEVLAGIAGKSVVRSGVRHTAAALTVSVISAKPIAQQAGSETDSQSGSGAYSLQDNAFFTGNNGKPDSVQFTDQSSGGINGVCVWQIVNPTQSYIPNCAAVLFAQPIELVEGTVEDGLLTVAAAAPGCCTAVAVVTPDLYGLGVGNRWNNSSGSILGFGNKSEAVFSNTEEAIGLEVSSCLNDDGFIGYSVFCSAQKLKPLAYVGYSPGPSTNGYQTLETNNLIPVIGSPPTKLPTPLTYFFGGHTAQINYTATTSGHCWTGSPPYCG